ncbi:Lipase/lipooxygenase [Dunaliella salina]|uniref:Lipase/lipooxygenase n=1 Tax=Dunaliella salina TaxID=3046 RepID=A0ABQ7GWU5_DUNSA|nr:Lipase/lipooxygenase [Dunaliella salina]|eukprot:KAF5839075.1 Lipase/lipooxygenase [Dunaliella salina]
MHSLLSTRPLCRIWTGKREDMAHLGVKLEPNTVFGLVSGSHTIYFAAGTPDEARAWVRAIHEAWVHCFKHTLRGTDTKDQVHETSRLMAANEALRKSLLEAKDENNVEQIQNEAWSQYVEEKARNKMLEQKLNSNAVYEVEVKTGGVKGASTDARVSMEMMAPFDESTSEPIRLAIPDSHHPSFGRNALDIFLVTAKDVGLPRLIKIWHDNTGRHPDWHLEYVRIRKKLGQAPPGPASVRCSPRSPYFQAKRTRPPSAPGASGGVRKVNVKGRGGGRGGVVGGAAGLRHSSVMGAADLHHPPRPRSAMHRGLDPSRVGGRGAGSVMMRRSRDLVGGVGMANMPHGPRPLDSHGKNGVGVHSAMGAEGLGAHALAAGDGGGMVEGDSREWMLEGVWGPWVAFPCHRWLSTEVDDCRISRTLFAGHQSPLHTYKVQTHTSDIRGASTDANVHLIMHGTLGDGKRHILSSGPNDFERGVTNEFEIDDEELGELLEITIGHDGTSSSPSWHLDHAIIINTKTEQKFVFPCRQWFDARMGDQRIERTLPACADAGSVVAYNFKITTADVRGASTDADVYVSLHGTKGSTPVTSLPSQPENFERGITDSFRLLLQDVGEVHSMTIGHNNHGQGPDWCMEMAEVRRIESEESKGSTYYFPCNKWFGTDSEAGGQLERTLVATKEDPRKHLTEYAVAFHTSTERGAGTDANVSFQLFGDKGQSDWQRVVASKEAFERGTIDKFAFKGIKYLGRLNKMVIRHDNTGAQPGWHLFKAVVSCAKDGSTTTFMCNKWIQSEDPRHQPTVELAAGGAVPEITKYHLEIFTSTLKGAGTDGNVSIKLHGSEGTLGPYQLDAPNAFGRGSKDSFVLDRVPDVGILESIDVTHDGSGTRPKWHLNRIVMSKGDRPPDPDGENAVFFPCGSWFGEDSGFTKNLKASRMIPEEGQIPYNLRLLTADVKGAGTDASIFARVVGSFKDSGWLPLLANHDTFERGQEDVFVLNLPELGAIQSLSLRTDGKSEKPSWCLDWAVVEPGEQTWKGQKQLAPNTRRAPPAFFVAGPNGWLGPPPLRSELSMTPTDRDPRGDKVEFTVWVHTSDVKNAGTDADILLEIVGSRCTSSRKPLVDPSGQRDLFERGQVDEFHVHCRDVGLVQSIILESNGMSSKPSWHLEKVVIEGPDKQKLFFPYGNWLGPSSRLQMEIPGQLRDPFDDRQAYEVITRTSNLQNAGTDANVYVEIRGIMGSTGRLPLRNDSIDCFERGQEDKFMVQAPKDLGPLVELVIGHDECGGLKDAWHLEQVDVVDPSGKKLYFDCERWLDSRNGLEAVLEPSETDPRGTRRAYTVTTKTGDSATASTDANVYVDIRGASGSSGRQWLRNASISPFQNGKEDTFTVECKDVGPLRELVVGHDNTGISPSWFLETMTVVDNATNTTYWFLCDQWLDSTQGDGRTERVLRASTQPVEAKRNAPYQVIVKTSDVSGASTNANVTMTMFGAKGRDTGPLRLTGTGKACFQRGQEDHFHLTALDVGPLTKIRIGHDNSGGIGAPWHLAYVEVVNKTTGGRTRFNANCWFSTEHDDYQIERDLYPAGSQREDHMYSIEVFTSNIRGAGTDCTVYCKLIGLQGETRNLRLDNPKDNMEAGQRDSFLIRAEDVGPLQRVRVWHNNDGPKPNWHLDYMTIVASARPDIKYWCHCGQWLDTAHGLVKELKALTFDPRTALTTYTLVVHTADEPGAGTDANVSVNIIGTDGESGPRELTGGRDVFAPGKADTFQLSMVDLGDLSRLDVWHDNSGRNSGWNLDYIEIRSSAMNRVWYFPCFQWLDARQGDGQTRRLLAATLQKPQHHLKATYQVTCITGNDDGAGTDAKVYINIFGDKGQTGNITLDEPGRSSFARGQTDVFRFGAKNVSPMSKIVIGHDGSGSRAGWQLAKVVVENVTTGESLIFEANRWLDEGKEDGALEVELLPLQGFMGGTHWMLTIITGDVPEAGTDADVLVEVDGERGSYGPHQLRAMKGAFGRGCHDKFLFGTPDLGRLLSMTLGHNNKGPGSSWYVERVVLDNMATGEQYLFQFQCWLDAVRGLRARRPVLTYRAPTKGNKSDYEVELTTGSGANGQLRSGTVMIDVRGSEGKTGRQALDMPPQGFFPDRIEAYLLRQLLNTGSISELEIGHTGPNSWDVKQVSVTNTTTGVSASFIFDKPLQPNEFATLSPGATPPCDYELQVTTSDKPNAGTTAKVFFNLFGFKGATGRTVLPPSIQQEGTAPGATKQGTLPQLCGSCEPPDVDVGLSRGGSGTYIVKGLPDVGLMHQLEIGHDNSGSSPSWHLAHVRVCNLRTNASALFPCEQWLGAREADGQTERVLEPTDARAGDSHVGIVGRGRGVEGGGGQKMQDPFGGKGRSGGEGGDGQMMQDQFVPAWDLHQVTPGPPLYPDATGPLLQPGSTGPPGYRVTFNTSNICCSGTSAPVFFELVGQNGSSGTVLVRSLQGQFSKGSSDAFVYPRLPYLGALQQIRVGTTGEGMSSTWHLRKWVVTVH